MNTLSWQAQDLAMLERFYAADQLWTWENIKEGNGAAGKVLDWLQKCPIPRRHPLVLPVRRKNDPNPGWICIAYSEMQCEELREHLNAFVGTAGCDFEGLRSTLPTSDKIASIAREWSGGNRVFDFRALAAFHREGLRERLERMLRVWALRPTTDPDSLRTTEAMLREFDLSLVNSDERSAIAWLEEIRAGGRLNAENLLFLKMQIPAAFGRWNDIDLDPTMALLAAAHRPRRTTAILIEATWHTVLKRKVDDGDVDGALAVMRERIQGTHRGLFRSPAGLSRPCLLLTFLIAAAADAPPRHAVVHALMDRLPEGSGERVFAEKVVAVVTPAPLPFTTSPVGTLAQAWEALKRDDFHGAWILLLPLPNSVERCRLLLDCAAEHWDDDTALIIKVAMSALTEEEQAAVLTPKKLKTWKKISAPATKSAPAPADWESWFHEVERTPAWNQAISFARDATSLWPAEIYLASQSKVSNLAGLLTRGRNADASQIVRLSLPHIAGYFLADGPQAAYRVLYLDLLLSLALDDHFGGEDWGLVETLASAIIETGPTRVEYEHLLSSLTTIWDERANPRRLDWALDLLDFLTAAPSPNPGVRDAFFESVSTSIQKHLRRLESGQCTLFKLLCSDLGRGIPFFLPAQQETTTALASDMLAGKMVAIYTLDASSGTRARDLISSIYQGVDVRLSHDHVGTDQLKSLARTADYFLMVTRSAKHAATNFIKEERPQNKRQIDYPTGKGSSSIVSALTSALKSDSIDL
jgi:hypothetical protein